MKINTLAEGIAIAQEYAEKILSNKDVVIPEQTDRKLNASLANYFLTKYSQIYLKLEWERVKLEIREEENINYELEELRKKYYKEYIDDKVEQTVKTI